MKNGNREEVKEVTLNRNVDYFELNDGTYMTIDALCKKYECQHTHIYRRAKEFEIKTEVILGTKIFKDSPHFEKKPKAMNLNSGNHVPLTSYATLHRTIEELIAQNNTHFSENTVLYKEIKNDIQAISALVLNLVEHQKSTRKALEQLMNYLTTKETK